MLELPFKRYPLGLNSTFFDRKYYLFSAFILNWIDHFHSIRDYFDRLIKEFDWWLIMHFCRLDKVREARAQLSNLFLFSFSLSEKNSPMTWLSSFSFWIKCREKTLQNDESFYVERAGSFSCAYLFDGFFKPARRMKRGIILENYCNLTGKFISTWCWNEKIPNGKVLVICLKNRMLC